MARQPRLRSPALALVLAASAAAQPAEPDRSALLAYREAADAGAAWTPPEGWVFRWRTEWLPSLTLDEVERREAEIGGRPDHPDRRLHTHQRRLIERGPQAAEIEVWWSAPGALRVNSTYGTSTSIPYVDVVVSPAAVFSFTPGGLAIVDPEAPPPDGHAYAQSSGGDVDRALRDFFVGGFGNPGRQDLVPTDASYVGTRLVANLIAQEGAAPQRRCTIELEPSCDREHSVVREIRFRLHGTADSGRVIFGEQVESGIPGVLVASSVELISTERRPLHMRCTWLGARPMEEGEFERVTQLPTFDSVDAARGQTTFISIMDFRSGMILRLDESTGAVSTRPMPVHPNSRNNLPPLRSIDDGDA